MPHPISRRSWLLGAAGSLAVLNAPHSATAVQKNNASWRMGLIADLHFGLAPDAEKRLHTFMEDVDESQPDCIMQLGDFNFGVDANVCMKTWSQFAGPRYHVLGNHDMDKASKQHMVEYWQMPGRHYSFDHKGWHFVVLDRNNLHTGNGKYVAYEKANFYVDAKQRGFADPEQLEWLTADLQQTNLPTVVFSHQGLGMQEPESKPSAAASQIESVLKEANQKQRKVFACFCGHHHIDRHNARDGIHYVWINSASYYWVGAKYGRMAFYEDALFTYLTFHANGTIEIEPRQTKWVTPSPKERGYPGWQQLNTKIQKRQLRNI